MLDLKIWKIIVMIEERLFSGNFQNISENLVRMKIRLSNQSDRKGTFTIFDKILDFHGVVNLIITR